MPPPCGDGACWYWPAKLYSPEGAAELVEHFGWLAFRMLRLTRFAAKHCRPEHGLDAVPFVCLDDRRTRHDVPILPRQHMAGQMVPRVTPEGRVSPAAERLPALTLERVVRPKPDLSVPSRMPDRDR